MDGKLIKVVVAEDELPLLRGISNMIESLNKEYAVVKRAKNGLEALAYINENPVDLVFTDINMPMMDGLELLKNLSLDYPEIATVVISGYDEFSYVQKAIRYRSKNYLLKPVKREELEKLLIELDIELKRNAYREQEALLTKVLFGNEIFNETCFEGQLFPICCCAGASTYYHTSDSPCVNEFWGKVPLRAYLQEICEKKEGIFCYLGKNSNEVIIFLEECSSLLDKEEHIQKIIECLLAKLPQEYPVTAAYKSDLFPLSDIKKIVYSLFDKIKEKGVYGKTTIIKEEALYDKYQLPLTEENALQFAVRKQNKEDVKKILNEIKQQMNACYISQSNLEQVMRRVVMMMHPEKEEKEQEIGFLLDAMVLISESYTLDQFFEDYYLLWNEVYFGSETKFNGEQGRELMQEVDSFIRKNIEQPITTKMLSNKFGLVSPYLSKLFKEYKGETPTQYIQNIRIHCAQELLLRYPNMLAKDVAEMVGYQNPLYFSKIFKKKIGVYPSEYRMGKKGGRQENQIKQEN